MQNNQNNPYELVIISTNKPVELLTAAAKAHVQVRSALGGYKGVYEQAFILEAYDFNSGFLEPFIDDQESVLFLGPRDGEFKREAVLYYLKTEEVVALGKFVSVTVARTIQEIEENQGGATIDVFMNVGYIVEAA